MPGAKQLAVDGFTFVVLPFGSNVGQLLASGVDSEQMNIAYRVIDKTDYTAVVNPIATYGANCGSMLYAALRKLAYDDTISPLLSGIYRVGTWIPLGPARVRVMNATFSLENESVSDVFVLNLECSVSYSASTYSDDGFSKSERKIKPSFRDAPWNLPPKLSVKNGTEDFVNGFAYSNKKLYTCTKGQKIQAASIRSVTLFGESDLTSVVNTTGEPFLSPPPQKVSTAEISIEANFTKSDVPKLPDKISAQVNEGDFSLTYSGVVLLNCAAGTLVLSGWVVSPEIWVQEIPWFPKEKHPLGFTYSDLYQSVTSKMASHVVVNDTTETVMVKKEYAYFATHATFTYRAPGFAAMVPNRGRNYLDNNKLKPISKLELGRVDECFLDESGGVVKGTDKQTFIGYSSYYKGTAVATFLNALMSKKVSTTATWARTQDK